MNKLIQFFSSYALATVLLILLLIYTFLGTLEQVEHGLYVSQVKYFESFLLTSIDLGACIRALAFDCSDLKLPVMLPGGYTIMALFCLNITIGGLIRIRKSPRTVGVVISHFSMVFMIVAGAVSMHFKIEGNLSLLEGGRDNQFASVDRRVVEIEEILPPPADSAAAKPQRKVLVIDDELFSDLKPDSEGGKSRVFKHASLPFELVLKNFALNAEIKPDDGQSGRALVDGYFVQPLPVDPEHGQNFPAIYAQVRGPNNGSITDAASAQDGILWLKASAPWTVKFGERTFVMDISRRTWQLPFDVRLDKATREYHPGTTRPRKFESIITQFVDGREVRHEIKMNAPLRSGGYTLFQHQMATGEEIQRMQNYSVFQVVKNPSDHWPLISCIAVGVGLLIHFISMLLRFLQRTQARQHQASQADASANPTAQA